MIAWTESLKAFDDAVGNVGKAATSPLHRYLFFRRQCPPNVEVPQPFRDSRLGERSVDLLAVGDEILGQFDIVIIASCLCLLQSGLGKLPTLCGTAALQGDVCFVDPRLGVTQRTQRDGAVRVR